MAENKSGKRIIAIAVSPEGYDEIQKLKGDRTWTGWLIELMLLQNPTNEVLEGEMDRLATIKAPKVEKPKAEPKSKKAKAKVEAKTEPQPEPEKTETVKGGIPVDISKIGKHEADEVAGESGELAVEK